MDKVETALLEASCEDELKNVLGILNVTNEVIILRNRFKYVQALLKNPCTPVFMVLNRLYIQKILLIITRYQDTHSVDIHAMIERRELNKLKVKQAISLLRAISRKVSVDCAVSNAVIECLSEIENYVNHTDNSNDSITEVHAQDVVEMLRSVNRIDGIREILYSMNRMDIELTVLNRGHYIRALSSNPCLPKLITTNTTYVQELLMMILLTFYSNSMFSRCDHKDFSESEIDEAINNLRYHFESSTLETKEEALMEACIRELFYDPQS